jgi:hypothetical protein
MTKIQVRATEEETRFAQLDPASGVQRIERARNDDHHTGLISLLADAETGRLVDAGKNVEAAASLVDFAAALPELLGGGAAPHSVSFERAGAQMDDGLQDLVMVSPERVHVAQRLPIDPRMALVSVANRTASIGWIVSEARSRLTHM